MKTVAIVPAAGYGKRLGAGKSKPFVLLRKNPIASYALKALDDCPLIDGIIVAAEKSAIRRFRALVKKYGIKKVIDVVAGGRTRRDSVGNCLKRVPPHYGIVLIHDAARPLVDNGTIGKSIILAKKFGACVAAVRETDTVKLADKNLFVKKTLDREKIFRAQTPQVFRREILERAYARSAGYSRFTDDSSLVEASGGRVKILEGSYRNLKITTGEDIKLAEVLL